MKKYILYLTILILFLNALGFVTGFCDWYSDHIYGVIADGFGRLWAFLPAALGELLMYLVAFLAFLQIIFFAVWLFFRKKKAVHRFVFSYSRIMLCIVVTVVFIYTVNWSLPMRSSLMGKGNISPKEYTLEQYELLRNDIVNHINLCAGKVARGSDCQIIYPDRTETEAGVIASMKALSREYPRLSGYYPPMKAALCSDVLDWMNIGGYTYPYTMEITGNQYVTELYYPALFAHESSHHQGFYKENEANFLQYLACIQSENDLIRYAGYLYIYRYMDNAYSSKLMEEYNEKDAIARYEKQPQREELVIGDLAYARQLAEEKYAADKHPLERFTQTAKAAADRGWSAQGRILAENSYDGVVWILMDYYDGKLWN